MTEASITDILMQFLRAMADDIRKNIPVVSGNTADSIEVRMERTGQQPYDRIKAGIYSDLTAVALETGRGPTKSGATKGDPTLQQSILAWIQAKGVQPTVKANSKQTSLQLQTGLSWAIATKIHKEGNALFRAGGKSGILSNVLTDARINTFADVFTSHGSRVILDNIVKTIQGK